jgi:hypothetical protein
VTRQLGGADRLAVVDDLRSAPSERPLWQRPVAAAVATLLVYVLLASFMSTGGYLGTDTGAKVATLEVMEQRGTAKPVLGYWAEDLDAEGDLHPIYDALPVDGDWVHVTTLPMLQAARPLWHLGGYRATLLLPMLGAVGAAFSGRSLARRAAGEDAGWQAYWVVALASPITVYALDFWEHAPGVACMVGATALLAGVVDGDSRVVARAMGAGALLGLSATMRTETLVYSLVIIGGAAVVLTLRSRALGRALTVGLSAVVGFAGPWLVNAVLEASLGGNERSRRVSGTASTAFDRLDDRAREAVVTLWALRPGSADDVVVLGGLAALLGVGALVLDRRGDRRRARVTLVGAAAVHLISAASGLGFVPGLFAAAPVALAALVLLPVPVGARYALGVALGSLPLVWAFQFLGGAGPQWAGRYALTSCTILVALGVAGLQRAGREVRLVLVGLTALISLSGVLWLHERSHEFERLFDELVDRPEDVVVARNGFFIREGGDAYSERLWLTAVGDEALEQSFALVGDAGLTTLAILDESPTSPARLHGADLVETVETSVVGVRLYLHSYQL